jgi:spore maturation protein CgeB
MRVCHVGYYADFYKGIFSDGLTYEGACDILRSNCLMYPNNFASVLRGHGFEVLETAMDLPPLSKIWYNGAEEKTGIEFLYDQISVFKPDILYVHPVFLTDTTQRNEIRSRFPFVKLIGGYCGFLPDDLSFFSDCDFVFSTFPSAVEAWKKLGINACLLHHAVDDDVLGKVSASKNIDFSFFGTTGWGFDTHFRRYRLLRRLLERSNLTVWGMEGVSREYEQAGRFGKFLFGLETAFEKVRGKFPRPIDDVRLCDIHEGPDAKGRAWYQRCLPLSYIYPHSVRPPLHGFDYLAAIAASEITANCHTSVSEEGFNMRLFEATGMQTCLLTDRRRGIEDLFEPGKEIMMYETIGEAVDMSRFLARNPSARRAIAQAGHRRTLAEHTTSKRLEAVVDLFRKLV